MNFGFDSCVLQNAFEEILPVLKYLYAWLSYIFYGYKTPSIGTVGVCRPEQSPWFIIIERALKIKTRKKQEAYEVSMPSVVQGLEYLTCFGEERETFVIYYSWGAGF